MFVKHVYIFPITLGLYVMFVKHFYTSQDGIVGVVNFSDY